MGLDIKLNTNKTTYLSIAKDGRNLFLEGNNTVKVGSEVLTAVSTAVFWVVAPCRPVEVWRHFRGPCDESSP
jgi:hypothetical protein